MNRATTDTVLVGQNALLREGLARILSPAGFRIFASACSVDYLIPNSLPQQQPILLIIDVGDDFDIASSSGIRQDVSPCWLISVSCVQ
jgi:two-component system, NarL family, nitrate/nitrite response regulator NarL